MTELTLPIMDADDARRLTERIRITATNARESLTKLQELVEEAQRGQAHVALGYKSWTAYLADVFGDAPMLLPNASDRQEVVQWLAAERVPVPAIAAAVGVSDRTVQRDMRKSEQVVTTVTTSAPSDLIDGMDGKTYTRPAPPKPRRRAITDSARDAGWELRKATDRLERIVADDRFATHKEEVTTHLRGHLIHAVEVCQDLLDRLSLTEEN